MTIVRIAARFRHYIFAKISNMPASEPFVSKGTVEHTSNCEFLLKIYHFPSFWKSLSSAKLTYTPTLSAIYALLGSLNADVSENTLPFMSQSINNFSDYDISQSVDWECPSLSPHVLLIQPILAQYNRFWPNTTHLTKCNLMRSNTTILAKYNPFWPNTTHMSKYKLLLWNVTILGKQSLFPPNTTTLAK